MSKTFRQSRRDKDYFDGYDYSEQVNKSKKQSSKKQRRPKYFDEYDSFESQSKYNFKSQKVRY